MAQVYSQPHSHFFLGESHARNERRTWMVIALCSAMMVAEIVGGIWFGSIALVADGLHMSTHASALLLAAMAHSCARRYAHDQRFSFGTGKLGDLAGFTSAIVLAMIAILIGYEAISRLIWPVPISFDEAIPIAALGLAVNIASAVLLGAGREAHDHHHSHEQHRHEGEARRASAATQRDNNMRAAVIHVLADAAVSVLVLVGLSLGALLGWNWMDPIAGLCGTAVIAAWSYGLVRDTGAVLLDMNPDRALSERIRTMIEADGDRIRDLHLWRLGPGHLGAILSVATQKQRGAEFYQSQLRQFHSLSHVTIQVELG